MADRPLRVAFVDYVLEPDKPGRSGLSDIVWDMASELVNQGHEAHIIGAYRTESYPDSRVHVHNFREPPIGYRNVAGHFWLLKRAGDVANRLNADVVHAPEYISTAVLSAMRVRAPLVLTVPGNIYHKVQTPGGNGYEWYFTQILKWAARRSARDCASVIAISREMKQWWEWTGSSPDRTPYIPLGVDTKRFQAVPNARRALGLPEDPLVLLYAGRFSPEKGVTDLLDALGPIREEMVRSQVRVLLVGRGPQEAELRARITALRLDDVVRMRGWEPQESLGTWYSAADALLLPSRTDAFGRTVGEAMSCGTPVIGTSVGGVADHVRTNITGFAFPRGDARALASVVTDLARDPTRIRRMRPAAREYVQNNLTWERVTSRVICEVYEPLAARQRLVGIASIETCP